MGEKSLSDNGERESMATDARRLVADGGSDDGLVTVESDADVETSVERVKDAIESNDDLGLMAEFDHEANADSVDRDLQPTTVLVFGNPDLGTPLLQSARTLAIDLPQKLLIMQRADGTVTVTYNDPAYLADRHGVDEGDERLDTVSDALSSLAAVAAGQE
ncbi:DUF302 domain-containing protein [Halolamina sp.]|uniref:DUF302 domain-containing protein n=1 Tax=Halolamina sp. TaxID=1940283 RepID=UPI00356269E2